MVRFAIEIGRGDGIAGNVVVDWRRSATHAPPAGAHELQGMNADAITEVSEVLAGTKPGRTSDHDLTVYKSTGHAVEDAATASLVYARALAKGVGVRLPL